MLPIFLPFHSCVHYLLMSLSPELCQSRPGFRATFNSCASRRGISLVAQDRDYILLDQRSEGYSQPSLSCQANETLQACHDRLVKEGINLNAFTTLENAADVHDLIRALGYQQMNLEGVSYADLAR